MLKDTTRNCRLTAMNMDMVRNFLKSFRTDNYKKKKVRLIILFFKLGKIEEKKLRIV